MRFLSLKKNYSGSMLSNLRTDISLSRSSHRQVSFRELVYRQG